MADNMTIAFTEQSVDVSTTVDSSKSVFANDHGYVSKYGITLVVGIGVIGNGISFATMMTKEWHKKSSAAYMATLAVVDTLTLVVLLNEHVLQGFFGMSIPGLLDMCNCQIFLFGGTHTASAWIIVGVTLDRVVAIFTPIKSRTLLTPRRTAMVISLILLLSYACFAYALFAFEPVPPSKVCPIRPGYMNWYTTQGMYLTFNIAYCYAPATVILAFNIAIIVQLKRRTMASAASTTALGGRSLQRITVVVVVISMAFVVLTVPNNVLILMVVSRGIQFGPSRYVHSTILEVIELCNVANHAVNFFLYVACSSNFRKTLERLLPERDSCGCACLGDDSATKELSLGSPRVSSVEKY